MAGEGHGKLVVENMVLGFEIGGLEGKDFGERGQGGASGECRVSGKDL